MVAVTVFEPGMFPRVTEVAERPLASVTFEALEIDPVPEVTAQSTVTPGTALPCESLTTAFSAASVVRAPPTRRLPLETPIDAGAPIPTKIPGEVRVGNPPETWFTVIVWLPLV